MTMTDTTLESFAGGDVAAALAAAQPLAQIIDHHAGDSVIVTATPSSGGSVTTHYHDLERYLPVPERQRGTVRAFTADGFVAAFEQRTVDGSLATVYADLDRCRLTAVLNDDVDNVAGWRDHRIAYQPQLTPEWQHWTAHQGLVSQAEFAAALEEGETELVDPAPTVMLEIAQTFHASTSAKFKQHGRLRDGRTQLVYEEDIDAKAGDGEGLVTIPDTFTIRVRPFYGAEPVDVTCRLRYRVERGDLRIGYTIHRPDEVVRTSFLADVVGQVRDALPGWPVIEAAPADPLTPGR